MITVCFYGDLRRFGRRFELHAATPAEALHALIAQIKGLRQHLAAGAYRVRWRRQDQSEAAVADNLKQPGSGVLHIVPHTAGAGRAAQIVVGVVLLAVAYFFPVTAAYLAPAGIGLIVGGVAQMLTKPPKMETGKGVEASKNSAFSNLANTAAQGQPVPLAYGRVYCGSRVISQGVETRRIYPAAADGGRKSDRYRTLSAALSGRPPAATAEAGREVQPDKPNTAADLTLAVQKIFVRGVAATAPDGRKYQTDFTNDSVRACNYTAEYTAA